jgi:aldehyde dehydrogenase (NAD+)
MTSKYERFDRMPIGQDWKSGRSGKILTDYDPWSGAVVAEVPQADVRDVDAAYCAAEIAQQEWRRTGPEQRAAVMRSAADIILARHDEIADWVRRESGGTVGKIDIELAVVRAGFLEAAGMPHHLEGRILPSDIPGKENRVYRRPVGVVCLISPWDFPMYLTNRTLAPALALGNAVVLKPSSNTPVTGASCSRRFSRKRACRMGY